MVDSSALRTLGEIQTMCLYSDKNPISLDLHFTPLAKQPNDLFTFYTSGQAQGISFCFCFQMILSPFSCSVSQAYFNFRIFPLFKNV